MRNTVPFKRLADVAPAIPAKRTPLPEDKVWHLSLDQVEANSGRIIDPVYAPFAQAGSSTHLFDEGNVLYSKLRPYLNKVVCPNQSGIATTELVPLRPDPSQLDRHFLCYYLRSPEFVNWVSNQVAGAKMPRVSMKVFWNHEIPLPPLSEQKRIAAILDKADGVRRKRAEAMRLADEFLKSAFLDLFGDPVTNPKGWPVRCLSKFYSDAKSGTKCGPFGGALKKQDYTLSGIPVWNMDSISVDGRLVGSPSLCISEDKFEQLSSYAVEDGDIIISRAGTVGKMCVVRSEYGNSIISTNLIRLRLGQGLLPNFFVALMTYCKGRVGRLKTGPDGAFTHMSTGVLDTLVFPYPPPSDQEKFVELTNTVEEMREEMRDGMRQTDALLGSLQQRAFRGEL